MSEYGLSKAVVLPLRSARERFGFLCMTSTTGHEPSRSALLNLGVLALEGEALFQRLRAEEAVRESEAKYRSILESMREGYYEVDLKGNFTFFNNALLRMMGYPEDEMLSMNYRAYYPDEATVQRVFRTFRHVYETGADTELFDWRIVRKDGAEAIFEASASLRRNGKGRAYRIPRHRPRRIRAQRGRARAAQGRIPVPRTLRKRQRRRVYTQPRRSLDVAEQSRRIRHRLHTRRTAGKKHPRAAAARPPRTRPGNARQQNRRSTGYAIRGRHPRQRRHGGPRRNQHPPHLRRRQSNRRTGHRTRHPRTLRRRSRTPAAWNSKYSTPRNSRAWACSQAASRTTSTTCSSACSETPNCL